MIDLDIRMILDRMIYQPHSHLIRVDYMIMSLIDECSSNQCEIYQIYLPHSNLSLTLLNYLTMWMLMIEIGILEIGIKIKVSLQIEEEKQKQNEAPTNYNNYYMIMLMTGQCGS